MKINKIIYWTSTIIISGMFLMSSMMYFTKSPEIVQGFAFIGFPPFMIGLLGTAKLLGAIALAQPKFKTLKEWAYAGFTITLAGATWAHVATNTPFTMPLVFMALLAISYISWKRHLSVSEVKAAFA
ncbi:MAG TPA: DoxX family protein [Flavipsychrobacter sp.]|nr:DoxX family protein [Flavipsychrobacter sp.]